MIQNIFLFFVFSFVYSKSCPFLVKLSILTPESQVKQLILNNINSTFESDCISQLLSKGYVDSAIFMYNSNQQIFQNKQDQIIQALSSQIKQLEAFNKLINTKLNIHTIEPVYQWGQSKSFILIQVKFAHRFDSPGCLNLNKEKIIIRNDSLSLFAFGIQAHQPIEFKLNINLTNEIQTNSSSWQFESVGKMLINLTKIENKLWNRIQKDDSVKENIWWEIKQIYKDDMEAFRLIKEKEEDELSEIQFQKERKKRINKQKQIQEEAEKQQQLNEQQSLQNQQMQQIDQNQQNKKEQDNILQQQQFDEQILKLKKDIQQQSESLKQFQQQELDKINSQQTQQESLDEQQDNQQNEQQDDYQDDQIEESQIDQNEEYNNEDELYEEEDEEKEKQEL